MTVGVVDERGEISAEYKGQVLNDLGVRTDVMVNIPKAIGMQYLIRSMGPQVIVADEIGKKEDYDAIEYMVRSGVNGIFSMHGNILKDIENNSYINELIAKKYIRRIIFLDKMNKGHFKDIYFITDDKIEHLGKG